MTPICLGLLPTPTPSHHNPLTPHNTTSSRALWGVQGGGHEQPARPAQIHSHGEQLSGEHGFPWRRAGHSGCGAGMDEKERPASGCTSSGQAALCEEPRARTLVLSCRVPGTKGLQAVRNWDMLDRRTGAREEFSTCMEDDMSKRNFFLGRKQVCPHNLLHTTVLFL